MKRNAFTLIELLVVIAIIAILAAILFPVFAQAKLAAKKTASLSNIKQIATASQLYSGDCDDLVPLAIEWNSPNWSVWSENLQPYTKNWNILWSPAGGAHYINSITDPNKDSATYWRFFVQYGYNAAYMNHATTCADLQASNATGNAFGTPISNSAAAAPADTIMFAESGQDAPNDNVGANIVYPPGATKANDVCTPFGGDWGPATDIWYGFSGGTASTRMGLFKPRYNGGVVSFMDGHAKLYKPGQIAGGTDWNVNQAFGTALIVDRTKYLWDLN